MKKKFILLPLVAALFYVLLSSYSSGPGTSGTGDLTGAHGGSYCGGSCHGSSATSSTTVSIQLLSGSTPVTTFTPGGSYTIQITGTNTSTSFTNLSHFGFQVSAVSISGSTVSNAGTLSTSGISSIAHTASASGITVVEHSSAIAATTGSGGTGTTYVVNIPWTAPTSGTGCVTIYGVLNAVNHNGSDDGGDKWNNTSLTVTASMTSTTGTTSVCMGNTTTLSNSTTGGTWSSANTSVATVGSTGVVTGVSSGTATISYTACPGTATTVVTVNPLPTSILNTPANVCVGGTTTLGNITPAGTWSSSTTGVATVGSTGVVSGLAAGTSVISYTTSTYGCSATTTATVNPIPPPISGPSNVCIGSTITLTDAITGGTWVSNNTNAAIGSASGIVTGNTAGTSVITYTSPAGCTVNTTITINSLPAAITGIMAFCVGSSTTLSDVGAGTWSSGSAAATVPSSGSGVLNGASAGTSIITFTNGNGCIAVATVTVNALPATISGISATCTGSTLTLSDATAGGSWSSSNTALATIGSSTGIVNSITAGTPVITYTLPTTGCQVSAPITINATPPPIGGITSICQSLSTTLSESVSGTWTSSNTGAAPVGLLTGVVTGLGTGTSVITFASITTGCAVTTTVTINSLPPTITGTTTVCAGLTTTLSNSVTGGTWSASGGATVGSSTGLVTAGASAGTASITYTEPVNGCMRTAVVNINPLPGTILGNSTVCNGSTTTLSNTGGGTWSSSATSVATIGATNGVIAGVSVGTSLITYTLPSTGCMRTVTATVNPLPSSITGTTNVCVSATTTLSDAGGGTWSSSSSAVATVGSGSGVVSGVTGGTARITYALPVTGCRTTTTITVNPLPSAISGNLSICENATGTLSNSVAGGTWSSSSTSVASISSTGIVTGVLAGTANITYTSSAGCPVFATVTINPLPSPISGSSVVCNGNSLSLSDASTGGTWTSSSTAVATVVSGTAVVTGTGAGTSNISYTLSTGCRVTKTITVNPLSAITGITSLCSGLSSTLTDAATGGTWMSSNPSIVTIGSTSGIVSTFGPGTSLITYTTPLGCVANTTVSVISAPPSITGNQNVCVGTTTTLINSGGGTWTSGSTSVATVGAGTGIVTGMTTGTATITYSLGTGCAVNAVVTVNPAPAAIIGPSAVCPGATITLSHIVAGGTWSIGNTSIVTVDPSTGVVTGVAPTFTGVTYTLPGGCYASKNIVVNPLPAAITGNTNVCAGLTTTLSDATTGGTWSSGNTAIATVFTSAAVVTGVSAGTTSITYTLPTTCMITTTVTVNPLPSAIAGSSSICRGSTVTLSDIDAGGTWVSSNANVSVGSTDGSATGVTLGSSRITYTLPTGCLITSTVNVIAPPSAITGLRTVCESATITLSDATTGGHWSSGDITTATVGSGSGVVAGVAAGMVDITYTSISGCTAAANVTVNPLPAAISGPSVLCQADSITLFNTGGGTWSSGTTSVATIGSSSGIVNGKSSGTSIIRYTLGTGCAITTTITVNPLPAPIAGLHNICEGASMSLSDAAVGGFWYMTDTSAAHIGMGTGIVSAISPVSETVYYALPTNCYVTGTFTVNPLPSAITGTGVLCAGNTTSLSNATGGGSWSSGSTSIATVGSGTGVVSGVSGGTTTISYALTTGCATGFSVTINPTPATITGSSNVCTGFSTTLSTSTSGGTWSSSATSVATAGSTTGVINGLTAGTSTITYQLPTGCLNTRSVMVNPTPSAITGLSSVCVGSVITLSDASSGGTWSSSATSIATVTLAAGYVTGRGAGTASITYTLPTSCRTTTSITVNPLPNAGSISGPTQVCQGGSATLSDGVTGGAWSTSSSSIATVSGTGVVSGVAPGFARISYTVTNVCGTDNAVLIDTIIPSPSAGTITGADSVCQGDTIHLGSTASSGTWSSSNTAVVTINSTTGEVTGVSAGSATISYSVTTPCGTADATLLLTVKPITACNVGIRQIKGTDMLRVYPNPSNGLFTAEIPATTQGVVITITDILGKVVETRITDNQSQKMNFDLSNLPSGSYILKANTGNIIYREKLEVVR